MISPAAMAIAAVTVMLWLIWSDTVRPHRPAPILYAVRVALFIIVAGILVLNMFRHPAQFYGAAKGWAIFGAAVGVLGAWYFARKLARR